MRPNRIVEQVRHLPGIEEAAVTSALPMRGWGFGMPFQIAGKPAVDRSACFFKIVSPGYFRTLGIRLRRGRGLSESDARGSAPVTLINETMVKRFFENEDPIGRKILIEQILTGKRELGPDVPWEVVGVVVDEQVALSTISARVSMCLWPRAP